MGAAPEPSDAAPGTGGWACAGLLAVVAAGAAFAGDGSGVDGILPVGGAAAALLAGSALVAAAGRAPWPRPGRAGTFLVASLVLLVAWTGATVAWSIAPDRSWDAFNRSLAYVAFLGLGLVLGALGGRLGARLGATALSLAIGAVLVWALVAKALPALDPEGDRVGRLREPVGYWNALALLADAGLVLGLWAATASSGRARAAARAAGALLVYVSTLALLLTLSRAGAAAALVVLAVWLAASSERVAGGLVLL
ncbi:MAG TPA: hypothetical protein VNJ53_07605, partial [Gaiellaceae bacterium]|nr:hypothetical protein [Gaiellaceae bacterium]